MTTLLFERVGDVLVLVHSAKEPSDPEWNSYIQALNESQRSQQPLRGVLVTTLGGAPNAGQRKALQAAAEAEPYITCVCTDSVIARGVITAITWLYSLPLHALRYHATDHALDIIGVEGEQRPAIQRMLKRLQEALPIS